ncbi:M42 family metallopeptidase [Pyrofollis japonicus]|uniref:M42 family metallopeptidase n=1 Tax=Pyrofollis japonicus TaxID=3060460 RepID=UPI00295B932D|nr:M42 family metallopeptidase [Pyrofollis japonicus]BEP16848.1 M42 family metallopeptidase [Pyrofollis japonicus]
MAGEIDEFWSLLKKLSDAFGVSGFEDEIRGIVMDELRSAADEVRVDKWGNVIAVKRGGDTKVMWAAHMDEIGFLVRAIDEKGFLYLAPVGGWSDLVVPAQRLRIRLDDGRIIYGVVGMKPPHLLSPEEQKQVIPLSKLFVDIGVSSREEAEKLGVRIGLPADLDREAVRLTETRVTGKAFDDRVGLAAMIWAFKHIDPAEQTIYAVATVQEEVGLKGARVAAFALRPDAAIALDVTTANDVPGVAVQDRVVELGKGPAIKVADGRNAGGLIAHPKIFKILVETAKQEGIPYQLELLPGGTTDAAAIAFTAEGVPAGTISIPTRYIHSPVELLDLRDALNTAKLLEKASTRINKNIIN